MRSPKQIEAARANGAKSRGPKTPEGKARSARNAVRHGLLADIAVIRGESPEGFQAILKEHLDRFYGGCDDVELGIIEEMAVAWWRLRRAWAIETNFLDNSMAGLAEHDPVSRMAGAFAGLAQTPQLHLLHRYEARLHRMYQRGLTTLLMLRKVEFPNEPEPPAAETTPQPLPEDRSPLPEAPDGMSGLVSSSSTALSSPPADDGGPLPEAPPRPTGPVPSLLHPAKFSRPADDGTPGFVGRTPTSARVPQDPPALRPKRPAWGLAADLGVRPTHPVDPHAAPDLRPEKTRGDGLRPDTRGSVRFWGYQLLDDSPHVSRHVRGRGGRLARRRAGDRAPH